MARECLPFHGVNLQAVADMAGSGLGNKGFVGVMPTSLPRPASAGPAACAQP